MENNILAKQEDIDWDMRRVQFSDVVQVEHGDATEKTKFGMETLPEKYEFSVDVDSDEESSERGHDDDFVPTSRVRGGGERRQSLAAQLLMAPAKWAQQKECRQRKMSLHGKPIYFTAPSRRKNQVRKLMISVFNFLERPGGGNNASLIYHTVTFLMVCASLILTVFATIPAHMNDAKRILFVMEIILVTIFTMELVARVWSAGCRVRYQGIMGRLHFARKPFCIIDITVVVSSFVIILAGNENHTFAATAMRGLRFLQILRMIRVDRRGGTWKLLGSVVYAHSKELITAWYIGFLSLILASFLVYQAEKDINAEQFGTFADALWWGLVTLTTIGYGDKTPQSWVGRLIACFFAILGISFFALPAGILGSGFALKVQEQHRQKHLSRRRNPAAYLIQCFWRCYAADVDSTSTATWQQSLRGQITNNIKKSSFRRKRFGSSARSADDDENTNSDFVRSAFGKLQERFSNLPNSRNNSTKRRFNLIRENTADEDLLRDEPKEIVTDLSEAQKNAIRGIRMMKLSVAKRKFKEALRPYDVKDVIEQYSSGHIDMISRVKSLQTRIDYIVGSPSDSSSIYSTLYRRNSTLGSNSEENFSNYPNCRNTDIEKKMTKIERKIDLLIKAFQKQDNFIRNHMMNSSLPALRRTDAECLERIASECVPISTSIEGFSTKSELASMSRKSAPSVHFEDDVFYRTVDEDVTPTNSYFKDKTALSPSAVTPLLDSEDSSEQTEATSRDESSDEISEVPIPVFHEKTSKTLSCEDHVSNPDDTHPASIPTSNGKIVNTNASSFYAEDRNSYSLQSYKNATTCSYETQKICETEEIQL